MHDKIVIIANIFKTKPTFQNGNLTLVYDMQMYGIEGKVLCQNNSQCKFQTPLNTSLKSNIMVLC